MLYVLLLYLFSIFNLLIFRFSCKFIIYVEYIPPIPCYIPPFPISLLPPSGQFDFFYVLDTHNFVCVYV